MKQQENQQEEKDLLNEQKRISFSEFKNWRECPYRHKLIHIDKIPYFESNEFTAFGIAMHEACEKTFPKNRKDLYQVFQKSFDLELKKIKNKPLNQELISEMHIQARTICKQVVPKIDEYFEEYEVFSVEEALFEKIDEFDSHGRSFKGFVDMILKTPDGKFHIIDWKTCSWGWDSKKKSDPITNYQLTYYKNYFSKKYNIEAKNIDTYFVLLKRTAKKENVEVVKITSGSKKTENSLKLLENAVINIENKVFIKNRLNCKYCKFYRTEHCR